MGYGISRTTHANRLWSLPVACTIADNIGNTARGKIALAISAWTNQLFVLAGSVPGVQPILEIQLTSGSTLWRSGDGLQGRSPNPTSTPVGLQVKDDSKLCSIIHELGHALGLAHEQDRPDGASYRATMKNKGPIEEQIAENSS